MDEIRAFFSEFDAYCAKTGTKPESVCRAAKNNPRLADRIKRRAEMLESDINAIRQHMRENPPQFEGAS